MQSKSWGLVAVAAVAIVSVGVLFGTPPSSSQPSLSQTPEQQPPIEEARLKRADEPMRRAPLKGQEQPERQRLGETNQPRATDLSIDEEIDRLMTGPVYPPEYKGLRDERAAYLYKVHAANLFRLSEGMRNVDRNSWTGRMKRRDLAITTANVDKLQSGDIFATSDNGVPPLPQLRRQDGVHYSRLNVNGLDVIIKVMRTEYPDAFLEVQDEPPESLLRQAGVNARGNR